MNNDKKIEELRETTLKFWGKLLSVYKDYYFWKAFTDKNCENSEIISENVNISYVFDTIYYRFRDLIYLDISILNDDSFTWRIKKIWNLIENLDKSNRKEFQVVIDKISLIDDKVIERIIDVRDSKVAHNDDKRLESGTLVWGQEFTNLLQKYKDLLDLLASKLWIKLKDFDIYKEYQYEAVNEFLSPIIRKLWPQDKNT